MLQPKQRVLRFVAKSAGNPVELMSRFYPKGRIVLNKTEWRGKEPRSCAVTSIKSRPSRSVDDSPIYDIEVTYRPAGVITYTGETRYSGWTMMLLDKMKDGTLLDGKGKPLPADAQPVYLPFEVFDEVEFNDIDFGEFLTEVEVEGTRHYSVEDVMREVRKAESADYGITAKFMAQRRNRPWTKIVISNEPRHVTADGFGTRLVYIDKSTPHLDRVILDELTELLVGFMEGRLSVRNVATKDLVFVQLYDVVVDCTPNEAGKASRFDCLTDYLTPSHAEDLAKRLEATYEVTVDIVDGPEGGLLIRKSESAR